MRFVPFRTLMPFLLLLLGLESLANAQICVDGYASTRVSTGSGQTDESRSLGSTTGCQPQSVFSGAVTSSQRFDFSSTDPLPSRQTATASTSAYATYGGLRGSTSVATSVGTYVNNVTNAGGFLEEAWNDAVTFHTPNPLGADFVFSITLYDSLGTTFTQGAGYARDSFIFAQASTALYINGGDSLLSVSDYEDAFIPGTGPTAPVSSSNHPALRTVDARVHVFDGQTFNIAQTLFVHAGVTGAGSAYADAGDTAFFNLSSIDATASYTATSGTVFLASGDPFAVSPVPEPSDWALILGGFGVVGLTSRRRKRE